MPLKNKQKTPPHKNKSIDIAETFISINPNFNLPSGLVILYDTAHTSMNKITH
jgi:hypothetical protein